MRYRKPVLYTACTHAATAYPQAGLNHDAFNTEETRCTVARDMHTPPKDVQVYLNFLRSHFLVGRNHQKLFLLQGASEVIANATEVGALRVTAAWPGQMHSLLQTGVVGQKCCTSTGAGISRSTGGL